MGHILVLRLGPSPCCKHCGGPLLDTSCSGGVHYAHRAGVVLPTLKRAATSGIFFWYQTAPGSFTDIKTGAAARSAPAAPRRCRSRRRRRARLARNAIEDV